MFEITNKHVCQHKQTHMLKNFFLDGTRFSQIAILYKVFENSSFGHLNVVNMRQYVRQ